MKSSMSEVCKLLKILIVLPCTSAVSERSTLALHRVKTYLRTTMGQSRLNHLMILPIHKERTDELSLQSCLNTFVAGSEHRLSLFEHFEYFLWLLILLASYIYVLGCYFDRLLYD